MAHGIDAARVRNVEGGLERLATKIDDLSESVDRRFEQVDKRFEQVDTRFDEIRQQFEDVSAALVEQRQYTEFAYTRLDATMAAGFGRVERKMDYLIDLNGRPRPHKRRR